MVAEAIPKLAIVLLPTMEAPARAHQPWRTVERPSRRLNRKGTVSCGSANERGVTLMAELVPLSQLQQGGGVVGAQGRHSLACATHLIAATEERLAREVDAHARAVARNAHRDGEVGPSGIGNGTGACAGKHTVDDGVLRPQGYKLGVAQLGIGAMRINRKGGTRCEVVFPGNAGKRLVELVGVAGSTTRQHYHDAGGKARPEAGRIGVFQGIAKSHLAFERAHVVSPQTRELLGEEGLEPRGARREAFHGASLSVEVFSFHTTSTACVRSVEGRRHGGGRAKGSMFDAA